MWRSLHRRVLGIDPVARISIAIACGLHLLLFIAIICAELLKPAQQIQISRQLQGAQTPIIIIDPTIRETKIIRAASAGAATAVQSKVPSQPVQAAQPAPKTQTSAVAEKKTTVVASKPKPKQKPVKKIAPKKAPKKTATPVSAASPLRPAAPKKKKWQNQKL